MATGIARSGVKRIRLHDLRHSHASNNTEYNYTEFNENESYQYLSEQEKGKDRIQERNEYRQLIHDNIEYVILCQSYGTGRVEELVELMLDAICSTKPYQQINGEAVPTQVVKSRLLKVGMNTSSMCFSVLTGVQAK